MARSRRGEGDPDRRERIVRAALEVIVERGVHDTTHRRIAERAGVPLGSLTYYFSGLADILEAAFLHLSSRMADEYRSSLESATTREQACAAVVDLICGDYADTDGMTALHEMYAYGNHNAAVQRIARDWMFVSRASLSLHFRPDTARALDALVEGWPMHRSWEGQPLDRALVGAVVEAVVERLEPR